MEVDSLKQIKVDLRLAASSHLHHCCTGTLWNNRIREVTLNATFRLEVALNSKMYVLKSFSKVPDDFFNLEQIRLNFEISLSKLVTPLTGMLNQVFVQS